MLKKPPQKRFFFMVTSHLNQARATQCQTAFCHPNYCGVALAFLFFRMKNLDYWVKIYRKIKNWEWYHDSETLHLFVHLLLSANHKEGNWRGQKIMPGQLITGRKALSESTGISEQSIRTCLKRLKSTNEITTKPTNKFSIITIVNWESYQGGTKKSTSKSTTNLTSNQPATNQQLTTNKNNIIIKEYNKFKINNYCNFVFEKLGFEVTHKNELPKYFKKYGCRKMADAVIRMEIYFKEKSFRKWKNFVFAKRWNKMVENLEIFMTDEALFERFEQMSKWNSRQGKKSKLPTENQY